MYKILTALLFLLLGANVALAQPSPPPDPWVQSGNTLIPRNTASCLTFPPTVTGGCQGVGTINAAGIYLNGVSLSPLPLPNGQIWVGNNLSVATPQTMSGDCTLSSAGVITCSGVSGIIAGTTSITNGHNNGLAYQDASGKFNVTTSLANAVAVTDGGSVPKWAVSLPNGLAMGTPASLNLANAAGLPSASLLTPSALSITSTGGSTAVTLADRFGQTLNLKTDFGAKCDNSTIDTTAINSWLAALVSTGKTGIVPAGTCLFDAGLNAASANGLAIYGYGKGTSAFKYVGASTTIGAFLTFGDFATTYQSLTLRDFSIGSGTVMGAGLAVRIKGYNSKVDIDIDMNGLPGWQGNLFNGLYLDATSDVNLNYTHYYGRGTGVIGQSCIEVHFNHAWLLSQNNTATLGAHIGGGCGGVYTENTTQSSAHIGLLVDNGITNQSATGNTHTNTVLDNLTVDTSTMSVGWTVTGTNIAAGTTIASITSYNSVTLSQATTGTGTGVSVAFARLGGTGNTHSNTTLDNLSINTANLTANMGVSGLGIPAGAVIASINSSSSITLSAAATTTVTGGAIMFTPGNTQFFLGGATFDNNKDAGGYFNDTVLNAIGKSIDIDHGWFASTTSGSGFDVVNWNGGSLNAPGGTFANNAGAGLNVDDPSVRVRIGMGARVSDNGGYGINAASPITINANVIPYNNTSGSFGPNVTVSGPPAPSIVSGSTGATGFTNGHVVGVSGGKTTDFGVSGSGTTVALTAGTTFTGTTTHANAQWTSNPGISINWLGSIPATAVMYQTGSAASNTLPELGSYRTLSSSTGFSNRASAYKILDGGLILEPTTGTSADLYANNYVVQGHAGSGGILLEAYEGDVNNNGVAATTLNASTAAYGFLAASGGTAAATAGFHANGLSASWQYGFAASNVIGGADFYTESNSPTVLLVSATNSHTSVVDWSGATVSGCSLKGLSFCLNGAGSQVSFGTQTLGGSSSVGYFHAGTNQNLQIRAGIVTGSAVALNCVNDAQNANVPCEINGSSLTIDPATTISGALTYGGVTLGNSFTGSAGSSMVGSISPVFTGTVSAASTNLSLPRVAGGPLNFIDTTVTTGDTVQMGWGAGNGAQTFNIYKSTANTGAVVQMAQWTTAGAVTFPSTITATLGSDATHTDNTVCIDSSSGLFYKGSGTLGVCLGTSSARFKEQIKPLDIGLDAIVSLQPKSFFYKKGYGDNGARIQYGFLAEDVIKTMSKLTDIDADAQPNTVDILGMVPVIVNAIKELKHANDNLAAQVDNLKRAAVK